MTLIYMTCNIQQVINNRDFASVLLIYIYIYIYSRNGNKNGTKSLLECICYYSVRQETSDLYLLHFLPKDDATVTNRLSCCQLVHYFLGQQGVWANKKVCVHINLLIVQPWQHILQWSISVSIYKAVNSLILSHCSRKN